MHRDDVHRLIKPTEPGPTIGTRNLRLTRMPVHRRHDFHDKAGRMHGLIVLLPVIYAFIQHLREQPLSSWFWWMLLATVAFALFARRAPYLRLSAFGISFPEHKSEEYPWDQMTEARARNDELDLLLLDGRHVVISFKKLRPIDQRRVKKLVKAQFQAMAERAKAQAEIEAESTAEAA